MKKTVYHCNRQGNYTLFYKYNPCKNKEAEIGKNEEQIKKTLWVDKLVKMKSK